jgi:chemotaxis protein MotA
MDVATTLGLVAGSILIVWALVMGGDPMIFWDVPSVLITGGGTVCATLIHYPLMEVLTIVGVARRTFTINIPLAERVIKDMSEFARIARRDGVLALEERMRTSGDDFLAKGLQLIIDGTESDLIREQMLIELNTLQRRNKRGVEILMYMSEAAPAFGMIGTLIGLVQMLKQLDDPSQVGAGMATALITTFYGALAANLFFIPLAGKLDARGKEEGVIRLMMIEGLQGIQSGVNPSVIEDRLMSYLSSTRREGAK